MKERNGGTGERGDRGRGKEGGGGRDSSLKKKMDEKQKTGDETLEGNTKANLETKTSPVQGDVH